MNKDVLIVVAVLALVYFMTKKETKATPGTPAPLPEGAQTAKSKGASAPDKREQNRQRVREFISHIDPDKLKGLFAKLKDKWKGPEHAGALNLIETEINNVA